MQGTEEIPECFFTDPKQWDIYLYETLIYEVEESEVEVM